MNIAPVIFDRGDGLHTSHPFVDRHVLLLAAHPDDEMIGAAGQFGSFGQLTLVHVTDGAFSHPEAWRRGWRSRGAYARGRLAESAAALAISGVTSKMLCLGARDRRASFAMTVLSQCFARVLQSYRPDLVLTHPYEGGHPDHDAAAFVSAMACHFVPEIPRWEMTSYHAAPSTCAGHVASPAGVRSGRFLQGSPDDWLEISLGPGARQTKARMRECFVSQADALDELDLDDKVERFRPAPVYDFSQPPHSGILLYETRPWVGVTGDVWRALAADAIAMLGRQRTREDRSI
jgi:LmbE family N-acetylglucosaminyl deacetylase